MTILKKEEFLNLLRNHIRDKYRTQRLASQAWEMSHVFLSAIVTGKSAPTQKILDELGVRKVVVYEKSINHDDTDLVIEPWPPVAKDREDGYVPPQGVSVEHLPTGTKIIVTSEFTRALNLEAALRGMRAILETTTVEG